MRSHNFIVIFAVILAMTSSLIIVDFLDSDDSDALTYATDFYGNSYCYDFDATGSYTVQLTPGQSVDFTVLFSGWTEGFGLSSDSKLPAGLSDVTDSVRLSNGFNGYLIRFLGTVSSSAADCKYTIVGKCLQFSHAAVLNFDIVSNVVNNHTTIINFIDENNCDNWPESITYVGPEIPLITIVLPENVPIRNGYIFSGWSESSTATSASYQPGESIVVQVSSTHSLYAVWTGDIIPEPETPTVDKVSVTYRCLGPATLQTISVEVGSYSLIQPYCDNEGFTFSGWLCSSDNKIYSAGSTIMLVVGTSYSFVGQWSENFVEPDPVEPTNPADSEDPSNDNHSNSFNINDGAWIYIVAFVFVLLITLFLRRH